MVLPVVKREVAFSLEHEVGQSGWSAELQKRLETENPIIIELLQRLLVDEDMPRDEGIALGVLLTYRFLESQGECNHLESLIGTT